METLKSKLKVVWAVVAAVVVLLGGLGVKDVLAHDLASYNGFTDIKCKHFFAFSPHFLAIHELAALGHVKAYTMNGGGCTKISPAGNDE